MAGVLHPTMPSDHTMTTFLITGGAGFIGWNLVQHVLARTAAGVVVLDKVTYASNPIAVETMSQESRVTFVRGDITDRQLLSDIFNRYTPSAVLNLAAETHVDRSI